MTTDDTHDRILKAALDLFSRNGYTGTTTHEIAERAGVNEVTLFRHFGSKKKIFKEAVKWMVVGTVGSVEPSVDFTGDLREDLERLANEYLDTAASHVKHIRISMMEMRHRRDMANLGVIMPGSWSVWLTERLQEMADARKIDQHNFELLSQMFFSLLFHYVLSNNVFPRKHSFHKLMDVSREEFATTCADLFVCKLTCTPSLKGES